MITTCPPSGVVTAIVQPGDLIKTASQKWYLVVNGPVVSISAPLPTVPSFASGRFAGAATEGPSCFGSSPLTATLWFTNKKAWAGQTWDVLGTALQFTTTLAQVARVDGQAISISLNQDGASATLTLRCSVVINSWFAFGVVLRYVSPTALMAHLKSLCGPCSPTTPACSSTLCTADPVIGSFNWTAFATGESPQLPKNASCPSISSCRCHTTAQNTTPQF